MKEKLISIRKSITGEDFNALIELAHQDQIIVISKQLPSIKQEIEDPVLVLMSWDVYLKLKGSKT